MGPDQFGTGMKLVRISLVFIRDLVDPDRTCYLVPSGSTYEGDPIWNVTFTVSNWSHEGGHSFWKCPWILFCPGNVLKNDPF